MECHRGLVHAAQRFFSWLKTEEYHHRPKRIRLCLLCHTTCQGSSVFFFSNFPGQISSRRHEPTWEALKDTLKSIAYQSQCTSKAAYKMVETASNILEELKSHKTVMAEQCTLMKTIASNQVEVSKLLKAAIGEEKSDVPPSGGTAAAGVPAGSTMPPYPPGFPQPPTTFGNIAPAPFMPFVPPNGGLVR